MPIIIHDHGDPKPAVPVTEKPLVEGPPPPPVKEAEPADVDKKKKPLT